MHFLGNIWWGEIHNNNQLLFQWRRLHSCLQKRCQYFATMSLANCHIDKTCISNIYLFNPWVWWHTFCNLLSNFIWRNLNTYTTNSSVLIPVFKKVTSQCSYCDAVWLATDNFIATLHKDLLLNEGDSTLLQNSQTQPLVSNTCLTLRRLMSYIYIWSTHSWCF